MARGSRPNIALFLDPGLEAAEDADSSNMLWKEADPGVNSQFVLTQKLYFAN